MYMHGVIACKLLVCFSDSHEDEICNIESLKHVCILQLYTYLPLPACVRVTSSSVTTVSIVCEYVIYTSMGMQLDV